MNGRFLIPLLGLLLAAGGCTLAPRYHQPDLLVPERLPAEADSLAQAVLPAARELYPDLRLRHALETALQHNLDLKLATLSAERLRAYYNIQRAELLPAASAVGAGSKRRTPADLSSSGAISYSEQYSVQGGISSWELDLFGRVRSLGKQSLEQYLASRAGERGARLALVAAVGQAWLGLAASREQLALASELEQIADSVNQLAHKRFEVGLASQADVLRADALYGAAHQALEGARLLEAQDHHALDQVVGTPLSEDWLPGSLEEVPAPLAVQPGLSSDVLLERPDIQAAEHRLKAANAQLGAARAAFFPRITLTGLAGTSSAQLDGLFQDGSESWSFAPQAALPLFDTRVFAAHRAVKKEREIAVAQYQAAIRAAFRETADALSAREASGARLEVQAQLVRDARQSLQLALRRNEQGLDSRLAVLEARRALCAARQSLVSLRLADQLQRIRLYSAMGGERDPS